MTDTTQDAAAQDTTAAAAGDGQSEASVLTPEAQQQAPQQEQGQEADAKAEGESTEKADQKQAAPEEYADFTLPEGIEMDADVLTEFKGFAKEHGISQEAAQKLIDMQSGMESKRAEQMQQQAADQAQKWLGDLKADKEFGGDNYDKNVGVALKAVEQFATPELRTLLTDSGLGNHPEMVKVFHRIGKAISDDKLVLGGSQESSSEMSIVDAFK